MPPPPPRLTRAQLNFTSGTSVEQHQQRPQQSAGSSSAPPEGQHLKRLRKLVREADTLVTQAKERTLTAEEHAKVGKLAGWKGELALYQNVTPAGTTPMGTTPVATPSRTPASELSGASTAQRGQNVGCAATACTAAHEKLDLLPTSPRARPSTRASSLEVSKQLERERAELARARAEAELAVREAEQQLWLLLKSPLDSWQGEAVWQLAMCEYAVEQMDNVVLSPKQLQVEFRRRCEEARHAPQVPRQRGSLQIDAVRDALSRSPALQDELVRQLARFKAFYCSIMCGFGRFYDTIKPLPGETLLGLMQRTHQSALTWRPPGRPPAEKLALVSKANGRYTADWIEGTIAVRFDDAGGILPLRGTIGVGKGEDRRYEKLPESERPLLPQREHFTTLRMHNYQAHAIQRAKALTNTFSLQRSVVQWDEATINGLSWCMIVLNAVRSGNVREREVLAASKLKPDAKGMSKTAVNVYGAVHRAVVDFEVPVQNIDYVCTDTTASNSSLLLPKDKGGHGKGGGGAYAHLVHCLGTVCPLCIDTMTRLLFIVCLLCWSCALYCVCRVSYLLIQTATNVQLCDSSTDELTLGIRGPHIAHVRHDNLVRTPRGIRAVRYRHLIEAGSVKSVSRSHSASVKPPGGLSHGVSLSITMPSCHPSRKSSRSLRSVT